MVEQNVQRLANPNSEQGCRIGLSLSLSGHKVTLIRTNQNRAGGDHNNQSRERVLAKLKLQLVLFCIVIGKEEKSPNIISSSFTCLCQKLLLGTFIY